MPADGGRLLHALSEMKQPPRWARDLVLGQGPDGYLYLPCVNRRHDHPDSTWWCRPYNRRNPLHWPYMVSTLITGWVVWLDA